MAARTRDDLGERLAGKNHGAPNLWLASSRRRSDGRCTESAHQKLLAAWIESGVLKVQRRPSPKTPSRERPAVIVGKRVEGAANEP